MTKTKKPVSRYVVMSVPDDHGGITFWFVYDRAAWQSVAQYPTKAAAEAACATLRSAQ